MSAMGEVLTHRMSAIKLPSSNPVSGQPWHSVSCLLRSFNLVKSKGAIQRDKLLGQSKPLRKLPNVVISWL